MNKKIIPVALTAMVMAVLAGCAKKDDPSSSIQPTSGTSETSATSGATSASPTSASSQTTSSSQQTSQTSAPTSATSQSTSSSRPTSQTSTTSQMTSSSSISPTTGSSTYIPPVPVEPVYAYVLNNGEPVPLTEGTDPDGEKQYEALNIQMNNGQTLFFANIAPYEPLTSVRIGGEAHGFTCTSGALTANHDGVYSFYLKLLGYEDDVVYISEAISYTVTSEEWNAAMGVDTIYGIANNFALNVNLSSGGETMSNAFVVEDNKMQETDELGVVEYYEVTQEKQYRYEQENSLWVKKEFTESPKTFIGMFLEFLGDYTNFRYVEEEHNYVCDSLTIGMGECSNIKAHFENKKLISWSADLSQGGQSGSLQATVTHGGQSVELPTIEELNATLKGTFDGWGDGMKMNPNPDNPTEVVIKDFHATENTKVKVYLGNDKWNETYKNVEGSSFFDHHVVIDGEGNAEFLVDGIFDIYYNFVEGDQHGVYIQTKEFDNPYEILTTATGLEEKSVARFNKVDVSGPTFVEYVCEKIGSQVDYTYSLLKNSSPVTFTLEEGGESANFTPNGNGFTYHGEALNLDVYIKIYAPDNIKVYFTASITKPVYAYILNTNDPVELTDGFDTEGKPQFEALQVEVAENDRIYFENIAPAIPEPLSGLTIGDDKTCGFTCVDGVLTASVAGTYNFYLKPEYGNDKVYIAEYVDESIRLMGSFDEWTEGVVMQPNGSSTTEFVVAEYKVAAGDKFRIRDGATWKENYKTSGGNNNAIEKNLCYVNSNNVVFRVSGVFTFYYDKGESNPGIYIDTIDVSSAYQGNVQYEPDHFDATAPFVFNKIELGEKGFVEYKIINVLSGNGFLYTILKNSNPFTDLTIETESGEGSKFAPSGNGFLYSGSATTLDFYLKESLDDHSVSIYIGIHQDYIYDIRVNIDSDQTSWVLTDSNIDIFVGAIDADGKTTWIPIPHTEEKGHFEVSLPRSTVKFLVVRCPKGTTTPNWEIKEGNEPGRIYNQTSPDTFLKKGVSEYEVYFVDYPRSA